MNIAFFGSSLVSAYWNGAATYYRGMLRAMAERGHRITFYEPDAYERQAHRDMEDPAWAKVVVYPAAEASVREALDDAAGAAACLITDSWTGIGEFFEPGREILVAEDGFGVARHLRALTRERAREVGRAAYRRVLAQHTYAHRAAQVEGILEGHAARWVGVAS